MEKIVKLCLDWALFDHADIYGDYQCEELFGKLINHKSFKCYAQCRLNTAAIENGQLGYIKQRYMRPLASAPLAAGRIANGTDAQAVKVRSVLEVIGKKYNADIESLAVAWLVKLGALPLVGTINEQRIRNIANAFSIDLDHQDGYELYAASRGEL